MRRIALLAGLIGAGLAGSLGACQCQEPLEVLAPKIEIGDPFDATHKICQTNFVSDCSFDFGTVGIGRPKLFTFAIRNPTNVDLNITSITIEGSPNFTIEGTVPDTILATEGAVGKNVTVKYSPQTETAETATVVIKSDAQNLAEGKDVEIALTGTGKDLGCPQIQVTPDHCDFGAVGVGAQGECQLTLQNAGTQDLEISDITFTPDTDQSVFKGMGVFILPTVVASGTGTTAAFAATPNAASPISGTLVITSNDCQNPTVNVPLTVQGAQTPTAVARVKSINGQANSQANPPVQPLDNVVVSGDQSAPGTSGATITAYQWTIVSAPPESSARLSSPTSVDTGFEFDSANGVVSGLDVAGTFVVGLQVTDSNGAVSQNTATVTLNAVPTEGLHVQLTWSTPHDDIDLHLEKGASPTWCQEPQDCYYGDCKQEPFNTPPNWDGASGFTAGDPSLDIDDLDGFGPENINVSQPVNGTYVIGVHAYSGNGNASGGFAPTDVEVKIFVGGALLQSMQGHLQNTDDFWTVARVDVNGGTSITPIDTVQSNFTCF